jgi:hypothetical protein
MQDQIVSVRSTWRPVNQSLEVRQVPPAERKGEEKR